MTSARLQYEYFQAPDRLLIRYGKWRQPKNAAGSVVLLGGRAEFIEKHLETLSDLYHRGYDVYTMDWRGQGLSGRMLKDRHKGYVGSYDDYVSDLRRFLKTVVTPEAVKPVILLSHSMGGNIVLRFLHDHPDWVDKAVLVSPMIDINTAPLPYRFVRKLVALAMRAGFATHYIIGAGFYDPAKKSFQKNRLTSDPVRFMDAHQAIVDNPALALGGATYGWLSASFASIDILSDPAYAGGITTPVMMLGGGMDRVVSLRAQLRISTQMPVCRYIVIESARHEILKEYDAIRERFWKAFDFFAIN